MEEPVQRGRAAEPRAAAAHHGASRSRRAGARASGRYALALVALVVALGLVACATPPRRLDFAPAEFRRAVAAKLELDPSSVEVPFALDPDAIERARQMAGFLGTPRERAERLAKAIVDPSEFGIAYDATATADARQVLIDRRGNCLGMSSLFVGLARGIGLRAYYLDASDRVRTLDDSEAFIVSSGHVTAVVRTEAGDSIVDFDRSIERYKTLRVMDDLQAYAHYYNNRGYDLLREYRSPDDVPADVWERASEAFQAAIDLNPSLARAWNNLGIAYARLGRTEEAEIRYRVAVDVDPDFAEPHNNLGLLYLATDRPREALAELRRAVELAPRNPHHHYHLALALQRVEGPAASRQALLETLELQPDHAAARAGLQSLDAQTD